MSFLAARFPVAAGLKTADFDVDLGFINQASGAAARLPPAAGLNGQFAAVAAKTDDVTIVPHGADTIGFADPGAPLAVGGGFSALLVSDGVSNWLVFTQ